MPEAGGNGGGGAYCFKWFGEPWGKDYAGWTEFRQALIDHGADVNQWIDAHADAAACIGAKKDPAPGPPPPPAPPPPVPRYCFKWFGTYWGKDFPGWSEFRKALLSHGDDPATWIANHADAAKCIGAPAAPAPPPPPPPSPPPPPPGPPTPGYQANVGPWTGRGIYTTTDATRALEFLPGCTWACVRPDMTTPAEVAQLQAAGMTVSAWEGSATAAGVAFALAHCAGYVAQAEGPDQLAAAEAQEAALGSLPKALVSNNFMDAYPAGWVAHVEAYTNEQANLTIGAAVQDALNRGAQAVVPIVGLYNGKLGDYGAAHYLADAAAMGVVNIGAYEAGSVPAADVAVWATPGPAPPSSPPPSGGPGSSGGGTQGSGGSTQGGVLPDGRRYCFQWGGEYWGRDFAGWDDFATWLTDRGADVLGWITSHVDAAACIGAPAGISEDGFGSAPSVDFTADVVDKSTPIPMCNPFQRGASMERQDQGQDAAGPPGGYVLAIAAGEIYAHHPNPSAGPGFGESLYYKLNAFPVQIYVGHGRAIVTKGPVKAGQRIVQLLHRPYGNAPTDPWHTEVGFATGASPAYSLTEGSLGGEEFDTWLTQHHIPHAGDRVNLGKLPPTGQQPPPTGPPSPGVPPGSSSPPPPTKTAKAPAGTLAAWRGLMHSLASSVPNTRARVATLLDNPKEWIR